MSKPTGFQPHVSAISRKATQVAANLQDFGTRRQQRPKMITFTIERVAIARIQMLHQRAVIPIGFILCPLLFISPNHSIPRTHLQFPPDLHA